MSESIEFYNKVEYQTKFEHIPNEQLDAKQLHRKVELLEELYASSSAEREEDGSYKDRVEDLENEIETLDELHDDLEAKVESKDEEIKELKNSHAINNKYNNKDMKTIEEWEEQINRDFKKQTKAELLKNMAYLNKRMNEYHNEVEELKSSIENKEEIEPIQEMKDFISSKVAVVTLPKQEKDLESLSTLNKKFDELVELTESLKKENELLTSKEVDEDDIPRYINVKIKIDIVEYNEKSFALFGEDTKAHKETIKKELKARFNPRLKRDGEVTPGWIVQNKYLDKAKELFI